jgi:hypothetical protein
MLMLLITVFASPCGGGCMCEFVGSVASEESLAHASNYSMLHALCLLLGKKIRAYGVRSGDAAGEGVEE